MSLLLETATKYEAPHFIFCFNALVQDQIEDLQNTIEKQKKELKKRKDKENSLQAEVDDFRMELCMYYLVVSCVLGEE